MTDLYVLKSKSTYYEDGFNNIAIFTEKSPPPSLVKEKLFVFYHSNKLNKEESELLLQLVNEGSAVIHGERFEIEKLPVVSCEENYNVLERLRKSKK